MQIDLIEKIATRVSRGAGHYGIDNAVVPYRNLPAVKGKSVYDRVLKLTRD